MRISKLSALFAAGALSFAVATPASALLVTAWDYNVNATFSSASYVGVGGATTNTFPTSSLSWGTPLNGGAQSSLVLGNNPAIGSGLQTFLGGGIPGIANIGFSNTLTHNNNVLAIGSTQLNTATLSATVTLTPTASDTGEIPENPAPQLLSFNIGFEETPNVGPCVAASPPNNPCNDIFVLTSELLNSSFVVGGQTYFANIFPISGGVLQVLDDAVCATAGVDPNCLGFTTLEGQSNTLQFGFTISTEAIGIPEPATLALFGAALFGAGVVRRKSN